MRNKKILLVEDDASQAQLLARWLKLDGDYEVFIASDGITGFEMAPTQKWDLIISDVNMPRMNGFDFIKYCKTIYPKTPVLLITCQESMETAIKAIQNKADDLMLKPISRHEIVEKASNLITKTEFERSRNRLRVLAVGAHPNDVEVGCGGVLSRHRQNGDEVHILTLSEGKFGAETERRKKESEQAAKMLDAKLHWGGLYDTQITDEFETVSIIEKTINKVRPMIVYTHTQRDANPDHRNTFNTTMVAARNIQNFYCYQSPSTTIDFRPTSFADITDYMPDKLELISSYTEDEDLQTSYLDPELTESIARYWGRFAGYKKVEPFEIIRESK